MWIRFLCNFVGCCDDDGLGVVFFLYRIEGYFFVVKIMFELYKKMYIFIWIDFYEMLKKKCSLYVGSNSCVFIEFIKFVLNEVYCVFLLFIRFIHAPINILVPTAAVTF